jgi:AcrR family transcriptional regulator
MPAVSATDVRRRAAAMPPDERRAAIVRATLPLLVEHGEMVTTRQIADAAGIAEGTIFRAFPDKDALLAAVVEAALDTSTLDLALGQIDPNLSYEETLRQMVELLQKRAIELWRIMASIGTRFVERPRPSQPLSEPMVAYFKANKSRLAVPPAEAAQLLRGLTLALTHPSLIEKPMSPRRVVDLFLHGAGAR